MPEKKSSKKVSLNMDSSTGKFVVSDILSTRSRSSRSSVRKKRSEESPVSPVEDTVKEPSLSMEESHHEEMPSTTAVSDDHTMSSMFVKTAPEKEKEHAMTPLEEWLEENRVEQERRRKQQAHTSSEEGGGGNRALPPHTTPNRGTLPPRPGNGRLRTLGIVGVAFLLLAGFGYVASQRFAKLYVDVYPRTKDVAVDSLFTVSLTPKEGEIRGERISVSVANDKEFPASTEKHVERKASGTITIYNEYSSASQQLVATTRFQAKDGRIYRIADSVTVPGATVESGKVTAPGIAEAVVYADKAGSDYNLESADFSIPGFKDSSKYTLFYAKTKTAITGGFSGNAYVASDADVASARASLEEEVRGEIEQNLRAKVPPGFILKDDAIKTSFDAKVIDREADPNNKTFLLRYTAGAKAIAFKMEDVAAAIVPEDERGGVSGISVRNPESLAFSITTKNIEDGNITMQVSGAATLVWNLNEEDIRKALQGVKNTQFNTIFSQFSAIRTAEAKLSFPWLTRAPADEKNIIVTIKD